MSGFMYIMASKSGALYVGSTANLEKRVWQHKQKMLPDSHTAKYNIDRLWYFEASDDFFAAREREYQIKKWNRQKKLWLIDKTNIQRLDLAADWFD